MEFIWASKVDNIYIIMEFMDFIKFKGNNKLAKFDTEKLKEGFHTSPKGSSQIVFITDPKDKSRISRAFLLFEKETDTYIYFKQKDTLETFKIEKNKVKKSLKTITGLKQIDITDLKDFLIISNFEGFNKVPTLSKYKEKKKFKWENVIKRTIGKDTYITIFRRFNPYSPNTQLLSFYSKNKFIPTDAVKIFISEDPEEALILSLFLNSIIAFVQLFSNKQETTGQYSDIKEEDLKTFDIINLKSLTENEKHIILDLFEKIKTVEFPSLLEQIEDRFWARVELDKTFFKILGFSSKEINKWLPKIYNAIVEELKAMKSVK